VARALLHRRTNVKVCWWPVDEGGLRGSRLIGSRLAQAQSWGIVYRVVLELAAASASSFVWGRAYRLRVVESGGQGGRRKRLHPPARGAGCWRSTRA